MKNENITYKNILTDEQIFKILGILNDDLRKGNIIYKDIVQFQVKNDGEQLLGLSFMVDFGYEMTAHNNFPERYSLIFDKYGVSHLSDIADLKGKNIFHTLSVFYSFFGDGVFDVKVAINKEILSYYNIVTYFNNVDLENERVANMGNNKIVYKDYFTYKQVEKILSIIDLSLKKELQIKRDCKNLQFENSQFEIIKDGIDYLGISFRLINEDTGFVETNNIFMDKYGVSEKTFENEWRNIFGRNNLYAVTNFDGNEEFLPNGLIDIFYLPVSTIIKDINKELVKNNLFMEWVFEWEEQKKSKNIDKNFIKEKFDYMYNLYTKKNADYGNSFYDTLNDFGFVSGLTRITDKYNRIKQLYKSDKSLIKDESMQDTLIDLATYCVMISCWLDYENFHWD